MSFQVWKILKVVLSSLKYIKGVLLPHFQKHLIAGWLDKSLKWRHKSTAFLDNVVVLAPTAEFVDKLPNQKIPDRQDFHVYANDFAGRVKTWREAVNLSEQLVHEFKNCIDNREKTTIQSL